MKQLQTLLGVASVALMPLTIHAQTAITPDLSKSFIFSPADDPSSITATHIKVPGLGNYDVQFRFDAATLTYEIANTTPSATNATTESFAGWYVCTLYQGTTPIFSPMIKPVGNDLLVAGVFQYKYLGISGEGDSSVWKYAVSFADDTKYLMTLTKPAEGPITAYMGYLGVGKTELDLTNTLKCEKKG